MAITAEYTHTHHGRRKLPVRARLFAFGVLQSNECTLCRCKEDHEHVLKRCRFLNDSICIVRRLWHSVVSENRRIEPSWLRLKHSLILIESPQGWLMWSATYASWLIRCASITQRHQDISTFVLQRWYSVLGGWLQLSHASLPPEVVNATRFAIVTFLRFRSLLEADFPSPSDGYYCIGSLPISQVKRKRRACKGLVPSLQVPRVKARVASKVSDAGKGGMFARRAPGALLLDYVPPEEPPSTPLGNALRIR